MKPYDWAEEDPKPENCLHGLAVNEALLGDMPRWVCVNCGEPLVPGS